MTFEEVIEQLEKAITQHYGVCKDNESVALFDEDESDEDSARKQFNKALDMVDAIACGGKEALDACLKKLRKKNIINETQFKQMSNVVIPSPEISDSSSPETEVAKTGGHPSSLPWTIQGTSEESFKREVFIPPHLLVTKHLSGPAVSTNEEKRCLTQDKSHKVVAVPQVAKQTQGKYQGFYGAAQAVKARKPVVKSTKNTAQTPDFDDKIGELSASFIFRYGRG